MKFRFEPNETVMYGGQGACTLIEICEKDFGGENKLYYVLRPAFSGSSVFYVPVDSSLLTAKMRRLKNSDEIRNIVSSTSLPEWIPEDRLRQNSLKQIIDGGDTNTLVSTLKLLITKQREFFENGKKLRASDERSLRDIERLLCEEFSFVFNLVKDDLIPFVLGEKELESK